MCKTVRSPFHTDVTRWCISEISFFCLRLCYQSISQWRFSALTPEFSQIAPYFSKVECFCFEEQRLLAGEEIDMPLLFFIDRDVLDDPSCRDLDDVVLSYTFFRWAMVLMFMHVLLHNSVSPEHAGTNTVILNQMPRRKPFRHPSVSTSTRTRLNSKIVRNRSLKQLPHPNHGSFTIASCTFSLMPDFKNTNPSQTNVVVASLAWDLASTEAIVHDDSK